MSPASSLVRGTSTRQPNSGRLSHQDSRARLSTADPTVATTGPLTASSPAAFSATAPSLATTLFCPVPAPPVVTTTGMGPDRPPSTSRAAASGRSSALPCSTSGASRLFAAAASATRSASPPRRSADSEVPPSATPAKDRKSTRLNSSHANISYAVFCLKKQNTSPHCLPWHHPVHVLLAHTGNRETLVVHHEPEQHLHQDHRHEAHYLPGPGDPAQVRHP